MLQCCAGLKQPVASQRPCLRHPKGLSETHVCMRFLSADANAFSLVPQDVSSAEVSTVHASK